MEMTLMVQKGFWQDAVIGNVRQELEELHHYHPKAFTSEKTCMVEYWKEFENLQEVLGDRLGDMIVLLVIALIGAFVLSQVPIVGSFLTAAFNVLVGLAFIDVYHNYKTTKT